MGANDQQQHELDSERDKLTADQHMRATAITLAIQWHLQASVRQGGGHPGFPQSTEDTANMFFAYMKEGKFDAAE